jgi:cellulose synthase/poly-beta-1,6-N-acetylglucosamine synthase-like glycosyltransferase
MLFVFWLYLGFLGFVGLTVFYLAAFAVAGRFGGADDVNLGTNPAVFRKIGVLIPAYKEDAVILESVKVNLSQQYPADRFDLIVIADSFQPQTLAQLAELPVIVLEVSFAVSTVAKAINEALSRLPEDKYDILVVSDADNHMAPDFLSRINRAFEQGWQAVQGHRVAKNMHTSVAVLDAISEEINNHIFRKGSRALGLSSSVIGSGMAFEPVLMKTAMANLQTMGGYDKELEMNVVLSGRKIAYLEDAFIYDEKVANSAVFENQRTRWIAAQWQFLKIYFRKGLTELRSGRLSSGFKVVQALILPKVLLLGLLSVCTLVGFFSSQPVAWALPLGLLLVLGTSLLISVPGYLWKRVSVKELLLIPVLMLSFARAMLNMRKAFKNFLHTPHSGEPDGATS